MGCDTHFVYLGNDIFRTKAADETLKRMATFIRYAARDTRMYRDTCISV